MRLPEEAGRRLQAAALVSPDISDRGERPRGGNDAVDAPLCSHCGQQWTFLVCRETDILTRLQRPPVERRANNGSALGSSRPRPARAQAGLLLRRGSVALTQPLGRYVNSGRTRRKFLWSAANGPFERRASFRLCPALWQRSDLSDDQRRGYTLRERSHARIDTAAIKARIS